MDTNDLKITNHAKERYAERIMGYTDRNEILRYAQTNEEKITTDLKKMVEYGTCIYEGENFFEKNKNHCAVYVSHTWVVIVDTTNQNLITLFSVNLGFGKELNETYVQTALKDLEEKTNVYKAAVSNYENDVTNYNSMIEENKEKIQEYQQFIKNLTTQNDAYAEIRDTLYTSVKEAKMEMRNSIHKLVQKKPV